MSFAAVGLLVPGGASATDVEVEIGLNFTGTTLSESGFIPPDSMMAVGEDHVVELINGRYKVYDKTDASVDFFQTVLERVQAQGWNPLGLHLLMGDDAADKFTNMFHNLKEDRVRVVQAVMKRVAEYT